MKLAMHLALFVAPLLSVLASAPAEAQIRDITRRVWDGAPKPGYVPTPFGWVHESCVAVVAQNARVERTASGGLAAVLPDGTRAERPECEYDAIRRPGPQVTEVVRTDLSGIGDAPPPYVDGWAVAVGAYVEERAGYWTQIHTSWTVPPPPREPGALIYFFNGLQMSDGGANTIVQPVLQYGRSPATKDHEDGNFWAATSWMVWPKKPGETKYWVWSSDGVQPVASGEQLNGHVSAHDCDQAGVCSWSIWFDGPRGVFAWLNVQNRGPMVTAWRAAAEFYHFDSCDQLPLSHSITFRDNRVIDHRGRERDAQVPWQELLFPAITVKCNYRSESFPGGTTLRF